MATFQAQVEGLTGLSIGTTPTTAELSTFLTDGAKDAINRLVKLDPKSAESFATITAEGGSGTIIDGAILDVWGSDGTNDHPASLVTASMGKRATDSDSLYYRSKYNPCYYREGRKVVVKPVGGSVLHIVYPSVTYDSENIYSFPEQYTHLLALYASIQSLLAVLADYSITDIVLPVSPTMDAFSNVTETIPTWTSPVLFIPSAPADANIDFSSVPSAPAFVKPAFSVPTLGSVSTLRLPPAPIVPPQFSVNTIDISTATAPIYAGPVVAPDFSQLVTYIETEEDSELASAQSSKIQLELSEFQNKMSDALNKFNEDNVLYQAQLQELTKTVDLQEASDNRELQRFQGEVSKYQAEVNSLVQKWQQEEWTQKFQKYTTDYASLLQEHSANIQNEQAAIQSDLQVYQQEISKATGAYSAETGYDLSKYNAEVSAVIQQFNSELQKETQRHQAELAQYTGELGVISEKNNRLLQGFSMELQRYTADMQVNLNAFNTELQDKETTYKWMTERLMLLKNQYDTAFAIQQPKRQEGE